MYYPTIVAKDMQKIKFRKSDWLKGDFSGDPVVQILNFHCWGHEFDPWSET